MSALRSDLPSGVRPEEPRVDRARRGRPILLNLTDSTFRHWQVVAATVLLCLGLTTAYLVLVPPTFVTTGNVLLEPLETPTVAPTSAGGASGATRDLAALAAESQIYVFTSLAVLDQVIAREHLETNPLFGARPPSLLSRLLSKEVPDPHALALRELQRSVSVARQPNSLVVTVTVRCEDRDLAVRIANAIMDTYIAEEAKARAGSAGRAGSSAERRLGELSARLREAENRAERYRREHDIVTTGGQPVLEQRITQLTTEITAADARVEQLRSTLAQLERVRSGASDLDALPEAFRTGTIENLRTRLAAARQVVANVDATMGPRHPARRTADAEAFETRQLVNRELTNFVRATNTELERARTTAAGLRTRLSTMEAELTKLNQELVGLRELTREVDASRAIYQSVLARSQELKEEGRIGNEPARIISRASPPLDPVGPPRPLLLAASVLLGLGLGSALGWLLDQRSSDGWS